MASDLFYAQLPTQSFSSGSLFGNAFGSATAIQSGNTIGSATANQSGNTIGTQDVNGNGFSFENTLHRLSGTKTFSNEPASEGGGQAASKEHAESSSGPLDNSQAAFFAENIFGASLDYQDIGDDPVAHSNLPSAMNMLKAMLNELQNTMVLNNPSGFQFVQGPGAKDITSFLSGSLSIAGDQNEASTDGKSGLFEKLEAVIKQFEAVSENKYAPEIRNLIEQFNTILGGDSAKIVKTAEMANIIQKLAHFSASVPGEWNRPYQTMLPADSSQTANLTPAENTSSLNLVNVLTGATQPPQGSSNTLFEQSSLENSNLGNNTKGKQVETRTEVSGMPKAVPGAVNASALIKGNEQTLSPMPEANEIKSPKTGQKEMIGLHLDQRLGGEFNQNNSAPVAPAKASVQQNNAIFQNAEAVNLKTDGSTADAAAGKMAHPESGNQENGFSSGGQQQNELKASERAYLNEHSEMVQKKFRTQTLDQIVQKAALQLKNGQNEVQINLKPDFLGQIRMQIITDSQQVTVRILAEFPAVKELIETNAHQLRSELQSHGLDIDELEVSVSQHPDRQVADQNQADGSAGKNSTEEKATAEDGTSENSIASLKPSDGQDGDLNTKIDFFA